MGRLRTARRYSHASPDIMTGTLRETRASSYCLCLGLSSTADAQCSFEDSRELDCWGENSRGGEESRGWKKLVGILDPGIWRSREVGGWEYRNFEAITELEMLGFGRGQAGGMMKLRLAYSKDVEKLPAEA